MDYAVTVPLEEADKIVEQAILFANSLDSIVGGDDEAQAFLRSETVQDWARRHPTKGHWVPGERR